MCIGSETTGTVHAAASPANVGDPTGETEH